MDPDSIHHDAPGGANEPNEPIDLAAYRAQRDENGNDPDGNRTDPPPAAPAARNPLDEYALFCSLASGFDQDGLLARFERKRRTQRRGRGVADQREPRLFAHYETQNDASGGDLAQLSFEDCIRVLRALSRVPFGRHGETLYPVLSLIWSPICDRAYELDPDRARTAVGVAMQCRPKKEAA